jgi:hypothetical protein
MRPAGAWNCYLRGVAKSFSISCRIILQSCRFSLVQDPQFLFMPRELPDNLSSMSTKSEKAMLLGARLYSQTVCLYCFVVMSPGSALDCGAKVALFKPGAWCMAHFALSERSDSWKVFSCK